VKHFLAAVLLALPDIFQHCSPGIEYCHVSKIKQYGWLIYT
jgi:hypothetical protein